MLGGASPRTPAPQRCGRREVWYESAAGAGGCGKNCWMAPQICSACGTSYPDAVQPPSLCPICRDERQFVPAAGQALDDSGKACQRARQCVAAIGNRPVRNSHPSRFGIGQRALLLRTSEGNVLWDCIALLDDATEALILRAGWPSCDRNFAPSLLHLHAGLGAPHLIVRSIFTPRTWNGSCVRIPRCVFGMAKRWNRARRYAAQARRPLSGGTVLHWAEGAEGRGAILSGDIVQVAADLSRVSFLWSYPEHDAAFGEVRELPARWPLGSSIEFTAPFRTPGDERCRGPRRTIGSRGTLNF